MSQESGTVDLVLKGLLSLQEIGTSTYLDELKSHLGLNSSSVFKDAPSTVYDEVPGGDNQALQLFKVQTIALGLSRSSGHGFSHTVNAVRSFRYCQSKINTETH